MAIRSGARERLFGLLCSFLTYGGHGCHLRAYVLVRQFGKDGLFVVYVISPLAVLRPSFQLEVFSRVGSRRRDT